jgi:hypothetical protein
MVTATDGEDRDVRGHPRSKVKVKVKFEKSSEIAHNVVPKSKNDVF